MLIEKRLEGMENRQEEFLEKLEKTIRKKWERWAVVYLEETNPKRGPYRLSSGTIINVVYKNTLNALKIKRMENSVTISFSERLCQVRAEKSADDLVVLSDGFLLTRMGKFGERLFRFAWVVLLLAPAIIFFESLLIGSFSIMVQNWAKILLLVSAYYGFIIPIVMATRRGHGSKHEQNMLNRFLDDCIRGAINSFKATNS